MNVAWVDAPPVANAGPDQTVPEGATVLLDGSKSTDPDDGIASYSWKQTGGVSVVLQGADTVSPSFTAPNVGRKGQTLTFQLTVMDKGGLQSGDSCIVNVTRVNAPPTANAGSDQSVFVGQTVRLNGSGSTDSDDGIASYRWSQTGGPPVTLSNAKAIKPTFKAPPVTQDGTALGFLLTVTDKGGLSATARCTVTVHEKTADLTGRWTAFGYTGAEITGTFQIRNSGNGGAGQFTTSFYLSPDGVNPGAPVKKHVTQGLKAGGSVEVGFDYSQSGLSGEYILAVIDSANQAGGTGGPGSTVSQKIP